MAEEKRHNTDDEIQILGSDPKSNKRSSSKHKKIIIAIGIIILLIITAVSVRSLMTGNIAVTPISSENTVIQSEQKENTLSQKNIQIGFMEVLEETVNDVPMFIYIPRDAYPVLSLNRPTRTDSSIVFIAQAADIRADNQEIVGDFVLEGKQLAHGRRKEGFCAIIDNKITISMAAETNLLSEAIEKKGYFFRQYPLVHQSLAIDNKPKGKAIRRALGIRNGQVMIVESRSRESFHDFAQALADNNFTEAVYLVGETAFGWYRDKAGVITTFGAEREALPTTSYIIWKTD